MLVRTDAVNTALFRANAQRRYLHTQLGSALPVPCVQDAACGDAHETLHVLPASLLALHELVPPPALFASGAFAGLHPQTLTAMARSNGAHAFMRISLRRDVY
jgi:hypothetical protein